MNNNNNNNSRSFSNANNIVLPCNVVAECEKILLMIKESGTTMDNLYVKGIIDDQISGSLSIFSYRLSEFCTKAINMEAAIQYFIQVSISRLHDYRSLYTRMGGKEPNVIYENERPIALPVINKAIFYVEGSYDNIGFTSSWSSQLSQQKSSDTKRKVKAKYTSTDNEEIDNNNNNNQYRTMKQQQQQQKKTLENNVNKLPKNEAIEFVKQIDHSKLLLLEYMKEHETILNSENFSESIREILAYRDDIFYQSRDILGNYTEKLSFYRPDEILNQIVRLIEEEKMNLLDYVMNVIQRSVQCNQYFNAHHHQTRITEKESEQMNDNNNNNNNTNDKPLISMYTIL